MTPHRLENLKFQMGRAVSNGRLWLKLLLIFTFDKKEKILDHRLTIYYAKKSTHCGGSGN
jgi:hypothetical protein